jgi:hypothetical protein
MSASPPRTLPGLPIAGGYEGSEAGESIWMRGHVEDGHIQVGVRTRSRNLRRARDRGRLRDLGSPRFKERGPSQGLLCCKRLTRPRELRIWL